MSRLPPASYDDANHMPGIDQVRAVFELGNSKYGHWTTQKDLHEYDWWPKIFRHMVSYFMGQTIDAQSGQHQLAHVVCDLLYLLETRKDRPRPGFLLELLGTSAVEQTQREACPNDADHRVPHSDAAYTRIKDQYYGDSKDDD